MQRCVGKNVDLYMAQESGGYVETEQPKNTTRMTPGRKQSLARQLFKADKTSSQSGWKTHIIAVCERMNNLWAHHTVKKTDYGVFDTWHNQAEEVLTEKVFTHMLLLVQYGVRELLLFLYFCVKDHLDQGQTKEAVQVLVCTAFVHFNLSISDAFLCLQKYWTPEKIIERTVSKVRHC